MAVEGGKHYPPSRSLYHGFLSRTESQVATWPTTPEEVGNTYLFGQQVQALGNYMTKSRFLQDCHNAINNLITFNKVTLMWISGHSGFKSNILEDDLARLGIKISLKAPKQRWECTITLSNTSLEIGSQRHTIRGGESGGMQAE